MGHFPGKSEILDGNRAEDAAVHAQIKIAADARLIPDAAADLDLQAAELGDGGDGLQVCGGIVLGAVQIYNMQIFRTCVNKFLRLRHGVGVVDGHFFVIALIEPHGLTAAQINGGV